MSQSCPLCGKNKPEETVFCDDCTKKIHTEYEVDIPEEAGMKPGEKKVRVEPEPESKLEPEPVPELEPAPAPEKTVPKKKKRVGAPVLFILVIALLSGAFFVYNATIRKSNLERSGWDAAVKTNSVEGYLVYMEAHPRGAHFDEAQAGLLRLKSEEATAWERMKETHNVTELRDFLDRHSGSPYTPLVKTRLDSLVWIGTLHTNTAESYSDYILLAENGGVGGDYIAEARKRYELLFRSPSTDAAVLDTIRTTIDGFFVSLSSLNHSGMFRYLAPTVYRFFDSGTATRERITGELLVTGAQTEGATLQFVPDLESVQYEVMNNNHYKVNVPLQKTYPKDGATVQEHGYIVHMELDPFFQIVSIFETKPYPEAP
ncbi:hypothetical protein [uncultured Proteiniphilum sp.]|uniref:hypothetical protein n=1 Tax=uncultured Proteiniphilum sp. TaxID=497637 RepID=UPI0026145F04|nr:hypothetical protein [uncultured Proteiniphilum sp.]